MLKSNSKTDRELSINSDEFVWDGSNESESHQYLAVPIVDILRSSSAKSVLDLGCGNGALSYYVSNKGFDVVGCDSSKTGIDLATKKYNNMTFFLQDIANDLPPEHIGKYDAVISAEVIEHLFSPRNLMSSAIAALRPGGIFVLTTPFHGYWKNIALALSNKFDDHWHPLRDFGHIKFFSRNTITALFKEFNFQNIKFKPAGRIPILACSMIISGYKPL